MVVIEELADDANEAPTIDRDGNRISPTKRYQPTTAPTTIGKHSPVAPADAPEPNVFCNVYDITPRLNKLLRCCSCARYGIYHSGVEIYDKEFAFGGHDKSTTGVWAGKPMFVKGARFREQVPIGHTNLRPDELRKKLAGVAIEWSGDSYETMTRNCNHFAEALCLDLTGVAPPAYVNRCAKSCCVRTLFYACVGPLVRCLERCHLTPFVTYQNDDPEDSSSTGEEYCIKGARGMNQVLIEAATEQKKVANDLFRSGDFDEAAKMYLQAFGLIQALSRLDEGSEDDMELLRQAHDVCKALLLNIAACNLKASDWERAISCCDRVLRWDARNAKAFYRRGVAMIHLGRRKEALANLQQAEQLTDMSDEVTREHIRQEIVKAEALPPSASA
eukprot:TRINITY_DN72101_c0_g1_i1.p1 TRINITY_DN72101_c0_g1~~TRINITY_DN72101_c0_g1_i1.p1  ORF type:complete len:389 (-),score=50.16 TRINITY_DN72101_c0_g1_i1:67-1233(-)